MLNRRETLSEFSWEKTTTKKSRMKLGGHKKVFAHGPVSVWERWMNL